MDKAKYHMTFDHMGYATHSIPTSIGMFEHLGYEISGPTFEDHAQGIKGVFLAGGGPRIELLENMPNSQTLNCWLTEGPRFYHMAYTVDDINIAAPFAKKYRGKIVKQQMKSIAFSGRHICFIMFRNKFLMELIENGRCNDEG